MASPLGLTDFSGIAYTSDSGNDPAESSFTGQYNSILNGSKFYYRPSISTSKESKTVNVNGQEKQQEVNVANARGRKTNDIGNSTDDIYDISTNSIIDYTNDDNLPALRLKPADFVYLRDLGVYPNNRLAVCRRFASPVENDLTAVPQSPISTVVSWIPDTQDDFFTFKTFEKWESEPINDPLKELTGIFNSIFAKATGINVQKEGAGVLGGGMFKKLPIGGIAEALETTVTNYLLGIENPDGSFSDGTNFNFDNLPQGNPNFMGKSAFRNMNSITSDISINIKSVYEMKYVPGVDPTIAFMDILQNLLRFSSSQSVFYLSQSGGGRVNQFFNKYAKGDWVGAFGVIIDGIITAVKRLTIDVGNIIDAAVDTITDIIDGNVGGGEAIRNQLISGLKAIGSSSLARYRIKFAQIIPATTGAASAPWHITIGNPKNPFFSSGDMIAESCEIKMNNTLGFNDLPTRIEYSFTMKSARDLGIQEIFDKFNIGAGRQYQRNSIRFRTDFYQGSVQKSGGGSTNPASGAQNSSVGL
jgi:hypothetical protein